jgi:hypothetical protein
MGYAFTDVRAFTGVRAVAVAVADVCAFAGVGRPASAPHSGRSVRRDP